MPDHLLQHREAGAAAGRRLAHAGVIRGEAIRTESGVPPAEALFDLVGDAHLVLIGEGSHGTHEFYAARAAMTRMLIEEKAFCAVAVEADWPDAYRVNRYVRGRGEDQTAEESLGGFARFPAWLWRNAPVLDFVGWLREHNDRLAGAQDAKVGFYGLDLYSLYRSINEVIGYLDGVDPDAAAVARQRYACFDQAGGDGQAYGLAAALGAGEPCTEHVVRQLVDLRHHARDYLAGNGPAAADDLFYAERNAQAVVSADEYYRSMVDRRSSWNVRDHHMADTLAALAEHLGRQRGRRARIVVWAHNSHVGDARPTEVALRGETNLGELVRRRHREDCRLIGLTTYTGTVTAADDWGGPAVRKSVRPALAQSVEELFHQTGVDEFLVAFDTAPASAQVLRSALLQRAIGVVYRPQTERASHYFRARIADQFDAVIHIDDTRAVEPLERTAGWDRGEVPQTYPFTL